MKKAFERKLTVYSIFVGVLGIMFYASPLQRRFAVLDDYRKVLEARSGMRLFSTDEGMAGTLWQTGRLVPAIVSGLIWPVATDVSRLSILRVVAFIAILLSVMILISFSARISTLGPTDARTLVAAICGNGSLFLLPAIGATVTFATLAIPLFAIPTALLAGALISIPRPSLPRVLGAAALIFVSVFSYQQMAVLATLPVFLWSAAQLTRREFRFTPVRQIALVLMMLTAGLVSNMAFIWLFSPSSLERLSNASLKEKLISVVTSYVPKSLHLFLEKDLRLFAVSSMIFLAISIASIVLWRRAWILLAAVLASYSVSTILFLGSDGDVSYRLALPGQFILWGGLIVTFSVAMSNRRFPQTKLGLLIFTIPLVLVVVSLSQAREIVYERISSANASDLANFECLLDKHRDVLMEQEEVVLRLLPVKLSGEQGVHSEIGLLASHIGWVATDMWNLVVISEPRFAALRDKRVTTLESDSTTSGAVAVNIIDLSEVCVSG